jgi:AcrR family transcriptional regulator
MASPQKVKALGATRAPLSADEVLAEALALLDEAGASGLTMRRLAARLGVDPMALYWHVPNKDAILDGVMTRVLSEIVVSDTGADWVEAIGAGQRAFRQAVLAHPHVFDLMVDRLPMAPEAWAGGDLLLEVIAEHLSIDESVMWLRILSGYVNGYLLAECRGMASIASLQGDERLSRLQQHSPAARLMTSTDGSDAAFDEGLAALLGAMRAAAGRKPKRGLSPR